MNDKKDQTENGGSNDCEGYGTPSPNKKVASKDTGKDESMDCPQGHEKDKTEKDDMSESVKDSGKARSSRRAWRRARKQEADDARV